MIGTDYSLRYISEPIISNPIQYGSIENTKLTYSLHHCMCITNGTSIRNKGIMALKSGLVNTFDCHYYYMN